MKVKIKKSEIIKLFPSESLIYKTLPETIEVEGEVVEEKLCHPRDAKPHIEGIFPKKETPKIELLPEHEICKEHITKFDLCNKKCKKLPTVAWQHEIHYKVQEIIRHINNYDNITRENRKED